MNPTWIDALQEQPLGLSLCKKFEIKDEASFFEQISRLDPIVSRLVLGFRFAWILSNAPPKSSDRVKHLLQWCPALMDSWGLDCLGFRKSKLDYLSEVGVLNLGHLKRCFELASADDSCEPKTDPHAVYSMSRVLIQSNASLQRSLVERLLWIQKSIFSRSFNWPVSLQAFLHQDKDGVHTPWVPNLVSQSDVDSMPGLFQFHAQKIAQVASLEYGGLACYLLVRGMMPTYRKSVLLLQTDNGLLKSLASQVEGVAHSLLASETHYWHAVGGIVDQAIEAHHGSCRYADLQSSAPGLFPHIENESDWYLVNYLLRFAKPDWTFFLFENQVYLLPMAITEAEALKQQVKDGRADEGSSPTLSNQDDECAKAQGPFFEHLQSYLKTNKNRFTKDALLAGKNKITENFDAQKVQSLIEANPAFQAISGEPSDQSCLQILMKSAHCPVTIAELVAGMERFFDRSVPGIALPNLLLDFANVCEDGRYGIRKHLDLTDQQILALCLPIHECLRACGKSKILSLELLKYPTIIDPISQKSMSIYRLDSVLRALSEIAEAGMLPFELHWIRPMVWAVCVSEAQRKTATSRSVDVSA